MIPRFGSADEILELAIENFTEMQPLIEGEGDPRLVVAWLASVQERVQDRTVAPRAATTPTATTAMTTAMNRTMVSSFTRATSQRAAGADPPRRRSARVLDCRQP
jgi:hypothetical protein